MRRAAGALLVGALAALLTLVGIAPSYAANDATIDHAQLKDGKLQLLVSVAGTDPVDLGSVKVKVDGTSAESEAVSAATTSDVRRTTMLAIDTSASMKGARIASAKTAALAYLSSVPANVDVGILTFDNSVHVRVTPTLDRTAARAALSSLPLRLNTSLYDGVSRAVQLTGKDGQREVLVLSDGVDNTHASLPKTLDAIRASGVKVDAVFVAAGDQSNPALNSMAAAGKGSMINAGDPAGLSAAFADEAAALARQVLVTVTVPPSQKSTDGTVTVDLDAGGATHTAQAFLTVRTASDPKPSNSPIPVTVGRLAISQPIMLGALVAIGLAVILGVASVAVGNPEAAAPLSLSEQISSYGNLGRRPSRPDKGAGGVSLANQARHAAEKALASNKSLEARIATRLEAAGMALRPAEWLLLHAGIALGLATFGLLLSGGSAISLFLFLFFGAVGPWIYLGLRRSRRVKAFDQSLADTLQLMSGSLSAGLSLAQSVDTIVREGTEPIASEFKRVVVESRLGVGLEDSMEGVAQRMDSRDFGWVVMAIRIQREVGGNLAELLLTVAGTLREREYLRRHVRALSAEGRLSCWILGGLPPGFLGYLALTKPHYVHPMFTTPIGWMMLMGMGLLLSVGVFWMAKVAKVEV